MDVLDAIRRRRSVRRYAKAMPRGKDLRMVLDAGRWAPSGLNNQPWRFQVLEGERKDGLCAFTEYPRVIKSARVAVAVFLDTDHSYNREKDLMAVGACVQNMLLAAQALSLGSCWLGEILNRKARVQAYLSARQGLELCAVVTLGYPLKNPGRGVRRRLERFMVK